MMKCLECGKQIEEKLTSCPNCGCAVNTIFRLRAPEKENIIYDRDGNEIYNPNTEECAEDKHTGMIRSTFNAFRKAVKNLILKR